MKKNSGGLRFLGEEDLVIGVIIMLIGGIGFNFSSTNMFLHAASVIVLILGLILTSFGIGDYLRS